MKKIFLALAILASMQFANAQVKSESAAKSALESAQAAASNAKKATKVTTWTKLGQAYLDAYDAPAGNALVGTSKQEIALVMGNKKPSSVETVELGGRTYSKEVYESCNHYYDESGRLVLVEVTKPVTENALAGALDAFKKAAELDTKGQKTKDITTAIKNISEKYINDAYNAYTFGDLNKASNLFEAAANAAATAPYSALDTNSVYNAGFTAWQAGNNERAKGLFEKCIAAGYVGEDGDAYAKLADVLDKLGDKEGSKNTLEQGFAAFPQSQSILIGLINYYVTSGENFDRLFTLLDNAKANEPNNASLYYVEGNIYKETGDNDKAIESYRKCSEINPEYEYGYIGEGILLYNQAVDIQDKAQNEFDDAKYAALVTDFEKSLKGCIEPFEKAFEVSKDEEVKASIAEYLKNACYRFREESPEFAQKYQKYYDYVAGTQAQ
jgi:tetratricopeptide (TPR) repeat protein